MSRVTSPQRTCLLSSSGFYLLRRIRGQKKGAGEIAKNCIHSSTGSLMAMVRRIFDFLIIFCMHFGLLVCHRSVDRSVCQNNYGCRARHLEFSSTFCAVSTCATETARESRSRECKLSLSNLITSLRLTPTQSSFNRTHKLDRPFECLPYL